jgi:hypothetical protein
MKNSNSVLTKNVIQEIQNRVKPALVTLPIINSLYYGLCIFDSLYISYKQVCI